MLLTSSFAGRLVASLRPRRPTEVTPHPGRPASGRQPDGAEVPYGGPWTVAVRGLPADRPLRVRCAGMPEGSPGRERWHSVSVEADERPPARTEDIGYALVDEARLAFADPDALTAWRTGDPADGLVDVAFWGRAAHILCERTGAGALDDDTYGWAGLPCGTVNVRSKDLDATSPSRQSGL